MFIRIYSNLLNSIRGREVGGVAAGVSAGAGPYQQGTQNLLDVQTGLQGYELGQQAATQQSALDVLGQIGKEYATSQIGSSPYASPEVAQTQSYFAQSPKKRIQARGGVST